MSKIFRTIVASSVIGGVALLSPLSAQAKGGPALSGDNTFYACPDLGLSDAIATVTGTKFSAHGTGAPNNEYSIRARFSYTPAGGGGTVFAKDKTVSVTTSATGAFSSPVTAVSVPAGATNVAIYRVDGVDVTSPLDNLAWTTDGVLACD